MKRKRKSMTLLGQRIPIDIRNTAVAHQLKQFKMGKKISLQQSYREIAKIFDRRK